MKKARHYEDYEDYIKFQSEKTLNPEKRKKWLGEEWDLKLNGFKAEFSKLRSFLSENTKILCIGARTGQEVVALKEMGFNNVIGIDIIPHDPHVIFGDMHNLEFEDESFDMVYTNIMDHSLNPQKFVDEIERVLKINGVLFLQCQIGIDQDQYAESIIENPIYDIVTLFNRSFCITCQPMERNFEGMNFEFILQKNENLDNLYKNYGSIRDIVVPEDYEVLWDDINLSMQNSKLDSAGIISNKRRKEILGNLKKRGYYLTRIAEVFDCKDIAEVGTAEGWQYYNFCKYISDTCEDGGTVSTCDPRDVRDKKYVEIYDSQERFSYVQGTSEEMAQITGKKDLFYIDGLHDKNSIIRDVMNLEISQNEDPRPVWIFDDFDERFGCAQDILTLSQMSRCFKVYKIGETASGKPSHQAVLLGYFKGSPD